MNQSASSTRIRCCWSPSRSLSPGRIRYYLCDTTLCVCLAFNACGPGSTGEYCERIVLEGPNSPCRTDKWVFKIAVPAGTFTPGECRRGCELCITLGSRDCCGKVGFVFGSCHEYTITVSPPETDEGGIHPLEAEAITGAPDC